MIAVDASQRMVEQARATLGDRAVVLCQDLLDLDLPEPVDVIFSTATFHWITDHPRLFAGLHAALKPGGRLVAQCGGKGNIDVFRGTTDRVAARDPYASQITDWRNPWRYASPAEATTDLEAAGFGDVRAWLEPRPVTPPEPAAFLSSVCLRAHLDQLPDELRSRFVDDVLAEMDDPPVLDYVRLNLEARRAD